MYLCSDQRFRKMLFKRARIGGIDEKTYEYMIMFVKILDWNS